MKNINRCCFYCKNEYESKYIQTKLFDMGYTWTGVVGAVYQENVKFLSVEYDRKKIRSFINNDFNFVKLFLEESYYFNNQIFNYKDVDYLNDIIKYGQVRPSYEPKRIIKESVDNEYNFCFYCKDDKEKIYVQDKLFDMGYTWAGTDNIYHIRDFNCCLVVDYKYKKIYHLGNYNIEQVKSYIKNTSNYNKTIFNYKNIEYINYIAKYGQVRPSYDPKRIIKESIDDLSCCCFYCKNEDECDYVKNKLFNMGYTWVLNDKSYIYYYKYIIINYKSNFFGCLDQDLDLLDVKKHIKSKDYCIDKIFNYNDIDQLDIIIKYGHVRPSYKLNKIIKE